MAKRHVYLCQVNNQYGENVFLPYSVGLLQAYCQAVPAIAEQFAFKGFLYLREDPQRVAARLDRPSLVGISCYIWNWEYGKTLAQAIKAEHPECLIVMGGPQVPVRSEGFFEAHPYADILVHHEGELSFADILQAACASAPDYTAIPGLSVQVEGCRTYQTPPRPRTVDLSAVPSPYLTGVFDELMEQPYAFHASQETHRGCPYSCTFCDWGSAVFSKVRAFGDQRLQEELDWFGRKRIDLLYNCDANYGILPRDYALTVKLAETKAQYGFPRKFRAAYAKNSNLKVFEIAKVLNQSRMCKGVTMSFQSLHDQTLELIKRSNIKVTDFEHLMRLYRKEGIPTYTEIILGLPGETYETFAEGLHRIFAYGQHDSLNVYTCAVLPNAEMGDPAYRARHGLQTVRTPVLLTHSTPSTDPVTEYNEMVCATKTMPAADWKRAYLFAWAVQCFHSLSLTQCVALFLFTEYQVSYRVFYEHLLEYARRHPEGLMGRQVRLVDDIVERMTRGETWQLVIPAFGDITWPPEEGTFLNLIHEKAAFYDEVRACVAELAQSRQLPLSDVLLDDLIAYQAGLMIDPHSPDAFEFRLSHDLHDYLQRAYDGARPALRAVETLVQVRAAIAYHGDLPTYAREVIWYGRKGGRFRHTEVRVRVAAPRAHLVAERGSS